MATNESWDTGPEVLKQIPSWFGLGVETLAGPILPDDRTLAALFPLCGAVELKNGAMGNHE